MWHVGFLLRLLGQKSSLDVRKNISLCDGDIGEEFVQLFVVTNSQLKVTADYSWFFIVSSSVARPLDRLEDLSAQILESCSQVHWSTVANSIVAFAKKTTDGNWELKPSSG